jgi:hypothetical protein
MGARGRRCKKSVTTYGALGRKSSHTAPSRTTSRPRRTRVAPVLQSHGIQASVRFHARNESDTRSRLRMTRPASRPSASALLAASG